MPVDTLAALNPELLRKRLPPDLRTWSVRLPAERLARFEKHWPEDSQAFPSHGEHVLRFGERVQDVAEIYGTTVEKLRRLNDLEPSDPIKPGIRLRVPDVEPTPIATEAGPVVVGVPAREFRYADRNRTFYRVTGDESLADIASFFRVTVDELRRWNDVSPDAALPRGLVVQVYVPKGVDLSRAVVLPPDAVRPLVIGSEAFLDHHEAQRGRVRMRYRVKAGDTLAKLADRFELSVGSIARINGFSTSTRLEPDREIVVYVDADAEVAAAKAAAKTPAASAKAVPKPVSRAKAAAPPASRTPVAAAKTAVKPSAGASKKPGTKTARD
jgi:membrane-bound lytic murein transglycosylase D